MDTGRAWRDAATSQGLLLAAGAWGHKAPSRGGSVGLPAPCALPWLQPMTGCLWDKHQGDDARGQATSQGTPSWQHLGEALGQRLWWPEPRDRQGEGAVQASLQVVTWEAGRMAAGSPGSGGDPLRNGGLSHSLRHRALHADETAPHEAHLARGHVPAHAPGQAGNLGTQDLDEVAGTEGHLFWP